MIYGCISKIHKKQKIFLPKTIELVMVVIEGLEPSASSLSETRSNQLSYMTIHNKYIMKL